MLPNNGPKLIRAPAFKRGRESAAPSVAEKVKLERVLGLTVTSNATLDCDETSGTLAYPAGCVVVLHNLKKNRQTFLQNVHKKTITSLAYSSDGRFLATGECGHQPMLRVWDLHDLSQMAEFPGHKYGISCVAFSPNLKYVVSVGSQHDMIVNVWDWKNNVKMASNKISSKVKAVAFNFDGSFFVTVGNRHVKFWYLENNPLSRLKLEPVPLMGRSAILGDQRNNYFRDVGCGRGPCDTLTYAITKSGLLCQFNSKRLLEKWVELQTNSSNCLSVGDHYIFIGCAEGLVRCFDPLTLQYLCTLPRPHHLGIDLSLAPLGSKPIIQQNAKFPHVSAICYNQAHSKVTCVYSDHSMYVWDVRDLKRIGKSLSFLYHSACIWGVEVMPELEDQQDVLPPGTFFTCSSDDTIRVWNLSAPHNIYSAELMKILYVDPDLAFVCDSLNKSDATYDGKNGVRCLRISPDGCHLASGDRAGNVRIFDLRTMEEVYKEKAHSGEVLCLEYSKSFNGRRYLASASRDRLIHLFDVLEDDYVLHQTLDDHSSSVTAICFIPDLQMVSCGADKSIIFRRLQTQSGHFVREHNVVGKTTLYDMAPDAQNSHLLTVCQDRQVRVYTVAGKLARTFRGSLGDDGILIKVVMDPTGSLVATSCTDKNIYIFDYHTEECLAVMSGHSELVTGLTFSGSHLISVSGDGCIFIWKLSLDITRLQNLNIPRKTTLNPKRALVPVEDNNNVPLDPDGAPSEPNRYTFNMKTLPHWAKKQMANELSASVMNNSPESAPGPKGRWAQRMDGKQNLVVRSYLENDAVIPLPNPPPPSQRSPPQQAEESPEELHQNGDFEPSEQSLRQILREDFPTRALTSNVLLTRGGGDTNGDQDDLRRTSSNFDPEEGAGSETDCSDDIFYLPLNGGDYGNGVDFQVREAPEGQRRNGSQSEASSIQGQTECSDDELQDTDGGMYASQDNLEHREKFIRSAYESLLTTPNPPDRRSISARFLSQSPDPRPLNGHSSLTPQTHSRPNSPPSLHTQALLNQSIKRASLQKTISDTRKKLESLGWNRSETMSSSQSLIDFHAEDSPALTEKSFTPHKAQINKNLRRASSMANIPTSSLVKARPPLHHQGKELPAITLHKKGYPLSKSITHLNNSSVSPPEKSSTPLPPSRSTSRLNMSSSEWDLRQPQTYSSPRRTPSTTPQVNPALCQSLVEEMWRINKYTAQLFRKVATDSSLAQADRTAMLDLLTTGIQESQRMLGEVIPPPEPLLGDHRALALLSQYSDRLLSLVEQRL